MALSYPQRVLNGGHTLYGCDDSGEHRTGCSLQYCSQPVTESAGHLLWNLQGLRWQLVTDDSHQSGSVQGSSLLIECGWRLQHLHHVDHADQPYHKPVTHGANAC